MIDSIVVVKLNQSVDVCYFVLKLLQQLIIEGLLFDAVSISENLRPNMYVK